MDGLNLTVYMANTMPIVCKCLYMMVNQLTLNVWIDSWNPHICETTAAPGQIMDSL